MLLFHPLLLHTIRLVLHHYYHSTDNRSNENLLLRALHLLTLATHVLKTNNKDTTTAAAVNTTTTTTSTTSSSSSSSSDYDRILKTASKNQQGMINCRTPYYTKDEFYNILIDKELITNNNSSSSFCVLDVLIGTCIGESTLYKESSIEYDGVLWLLIELNALSPEIIGKWLKNNIHYQLLIKGKMLFMIK